MSIWNRFMTASTAFWATWRGYTDPMSPMGAHSARLAEYTFFWDLYQNRIFDRAADALYTRYKADNRLVSFIRSIDNLTPKVVDFWRSAVYPGVLSADGQDLPDGVPSMVELAVPATNAENTDDLKAVIAQVLRWSNWQQKQADYVMWGAALGDTALEVRDLADRSKVVISPRYPGHITAFDQSDEGNVTYYKLEYQANEPRKPGDTTTETFTYAKEVDRENIRYFKNGTPFDYGGGKVVPNPYGFVPLVWVRHESRGGTRGAPAIAGSIPAFEAVNHLLSILIKDTERVSRSPKVIATSSKLDQALSPEAQATLREAEITLDLLKGNPDTSVHDLTSNLSVADILALVVHIGKVIERNHPEATMWERLREMSQVTGPAARRLVGDTLLKVGRVSANYDDGLVRACQMAVSIGAGRFAEWEMKGSAQKPFAKFDETSYQNGELDFSIQPRDLVPEVDAERWATSLARATAANAWLPLYGNSRVLALEEVGVTPEELQQRVIDNAEAIRAEQLLLESDLGPDGEQPPAP